MSGGDLRSMARKSVSAIAEEIHQTKPFATIEEELLVSLLRTTDVLQERFEQAVRPFNISMTQYNVLRILRGAEPSRAAPAHARWRGPPRGDDAHHAARTEAAG
jgi:hypothetical protein